MTKIKTIKYKGAIWQDISNVEKEYVDELQAKYKFHDLDCEDVLSENQRSKVDAYDNYLFLVIHYPVYDKRHQAIKTAELDLFVSKNYIISIHDGDNKIIDKLMDECEKKLKVKKEHMGLGMGFLLYEIVSRVFESCFPLLYKIESDLTRIEKSVFEKGSEQRDMLKDILLAKKNINTYRRTIGPERLVIASLEHKISMLFGHGIELYFDDVVDMMEKIWNNLEELKELSGFLQETNESVLTHKTNNTITILTAFSVIMLPITFVTSFYGMNVKLPYAHDSVVVWWLLGSMVFIVVSMLLLFKLKKWL